MLGQCLRGGVVDPSLPRLPAASRSPDALSQVGLKRLRASADPARVAEKQEPQGGQESSTGPCTGGPFFQDLLSPQAAFFPKWFTIKGSYHVTSVYPR